MKSIIGLLLLFGVYANAAEAVENCTQLSIIGGGYEAKIKGVLLPEVGVEKKYCLRLPQVTPKPGQMSFVEFSTVNLWNTSCGVMRMTVRRPDKTDIMGKDSRRVCKSESVQPGCILTYTPGQWIIKLELREPCKLGKDRWDVNATWSIKP